MTAPKKKTPAKKNVQGITPEPSIPIIGIGASAGGLEAFELFLKTIPADCGMAFLLVPHLDPGCSSPGKSSTLPASLFARLAGPGKEHGSR